MLLIWAPAIVSGQAAKVYYVQVSGSNTANDATTWATACNDLQAVIDYASSGDSVFVAAGVYKGGFKMKEGVQVYGGFKGTEQYTNDRTNKIDLTEIGNCSVLDGGDSVRVLTQLTPFTTETVWDGFVIRNGRASAYNGAVVFSVDGKAPAGVIYRWDKDSQSGYMVGLEEVEKKWGGFGTDILELKNLTLEEAQKDFSGAGNTSNIVKRLGADDYAAKWCSELTSGGFTDWYLPAAGELYEIYTKKNIVFETIKWAGLTAFNPNNTFLSSSESNEGYYTGNNYVYGIILGDANSSLSEAAIKISDYYVRAVHAFNSFSSLNNLVFAGGGALLQANGVLRRSVVSDNKAIGKGGGIYINGGESSSDKSQVQGCLIIGNKSGRGSGVYASNSALVTSSTIADNKQDTLLITRPAPPQIGDYYYTNGSYSSSNNGAVAPIDTLELVGIVCNVDPSNPYSGLILNSAEVSNKSWIDACSWASTRPTGGFTDWQLPTREVLHSLKANITTLNNTLQQITDATILIDSEQFAGGYYWSGSESDDNKVYSVNLYFNNFIVREKDELCRVRAVRSFNLYSDLNILENAGVVMQSATSEVSNSVIWDNKDHDGAKADFYRDNSIAVLSNTETGFNTEDPMFIGSGNYHLYGASPANSTGNIDIIPGGLKNDLDYLPRKINNMTNMGAYMLVMYKVSIDDNAQLTAGLLNNMPVENYKVVDSGDDFEFILTSGDGRHFRNVKVDDKPAIDNGDGTFSYTFEDITEDYNILKITAEEFFIVNYNSQDGTPVTQIDNITANATISSSPSTTRTIYSFGGWWTKPASEPDAVKWVFGSGGTPVTCDMTLHAHWELYPAAITGHPQGVDICQGGDITLTVAATGSGLSYRWYKNGVAIQGAAGAGSSYVINDAKTSDSGSYTVDVQAVTGAKITSTKAIVKVTYTPEIVTDLADTTFSTIPAIMKIEVIGDNLKYQWYHNNEAIPGAITESIEIDDYGYYYVIVTGNCGAIRSGNAFVAFDFATMIINRKVVLKESPGVVTNPHAGSYYIASRKDFVFEMWPASGYSLDNVKVTTDTGNEVILSQGEGANSERILVTVKWINALTTIMIEGAVESNSQVGEQFIQKSQPKVWSYDGKAYFNLPVEADVKIYNIGGVLYNSRCLPAGNSLLALPPGFYIIRISGMAETKIIIN